MKRLFDLALSLPLLVLAFPVLLVVAMAILVTDGRPVFFVQRRVGRGLNPFPMIKFRTMVTGSFSGEAAPGQNLAELRARFRNTQENDPRITRVGNILRKTSLDELPQLLNVVAGHMSLVGPRPDVPVQEADYPPEFWRERHRVRPGITGWAQVNGRSQMSLKSRTDYDLEYARKAGVAFDVKILAMTVLQLIRPRGGN